MIAYIRLANALRARLFRLLFAGGFAQFGKRALIVRPIGIERRDLISLGDDVYVAALSCLAVRPINGSRAEAELVIGNGCKIGRFNHIYASQSVRLGDRVLTANGVYISDNLHSYRNIETAVLDQPLQQLSPTEIGAGSWLGHNACVIGAKLGRNCVVGANAVVTRDAPDYSVIVGSPGRIIRRYDIHAGRWRPTGSDGEFKQD